MFRPLRHHSASIINRTATCERRVRRAVARADVLATGVTLMLLALVLVPAAGRLRGLVRSATCTDLLGQLGMANQMYANDNADWLPGYNTSGYAVRQYSVGGSAADLADPTLPVQSFDWMTPLAPYTPAVSTPLPANRAARMLALWQALRCPEQKATSIPYAAPGVVDSADFYALEFPACSYLAPASFGFAGDDFSAVPIGPMARIPVVSVTYGLAWSNDYDLPATYLPKLSNVGTAADKVFVADGTRYVSLGGPNGSPIIDHDINPFTSFFGAFTSAGAWSSLSTAYGVAPGSQTCDGGTVANGSASDGANLGYTYRHAGAAALSPEPVNSAATNPGTINAVFFDGSVRNFSDCDSRNLTYWYPSGTTITNASQGMTAAVNGEIVP